MECIRIRLKKAVRIISFKKRREHSTPFFINLEILPLDQHIMYRKCSFMWKLDHNQLPTKPSNFTLNDTSNTYIAQRLIQGNYRLPTPRLDCAERHIIFSGVQLWNRKIPKV